MQKPRETQCIAQQKMRYYLIITISAERKAPKIIFCVYFVYKNEINVVQSSEYDLLKTN